MVSRCLIILRQCWWRILLFSVLMAGVAVAVTRHLPTPTESESRIELRVRGYGMDLYQPDKVLDSLGIKRVDLSQVVSELYALADGCLANMDVTCDKTQRISIRIHDVEAALVEEAYLRIIAGIDQRQFEFLTPCDFDLRLTPNRYKVVLITFLLALVLGAGVALLKRFDVCER